MSTLKIVWKTHSARKQDRVGSGRKKWDTIITCLLMIRSHPIKKLRCVAYVTIREHMRSYEYCRTRCIHRARRVTRMYVLSSFKWRRTTMTFANWKTPLFNTELGGYGGMPESVRTYFGIVLNQCYMLMELSFLYDLRIILVSFWYHFRIILGSFPDRFRTIFESLPDDCRIRFGSFPRHFWIAFLTCL